MDKVIKKVTAELKNAVKKCKSEINICDQCGQEYCDSGCVEIAEEMLEAWSKGDVRRVSEAIRSNCDMESYINSDILDFICCLDVLAKKISMPKKSCPAPK